MKSKYPLHLITCILTAICMQSCRDSSMNEASFTIEEIDGVRYIHNHAPLHNNQTELKLEFMGRIGNVNNESTEDILWNPVDAARLPNGDILILEGDGCCIKRYNSSYEYISSTGRKGQGPGEFLTPYMLRLNKRKNEIVVADAKISFFTTDLEYKAYYTPELILSYSSIGVEAKTSGIAVLSDSRTILPSNPRLWLDSGDAELLSVYDTAGIVINRFGAVTRYENPDLMLNANIVSCAKSNDDDVYIAANHQNRISKYAPDGTHIFTAERPLPYEVINKMTSVEFRSGTKTAVLPWPSVTFVTKGVGIDYKNRVWALTFIKQPENPGLPDDPGRIADRYRFDVINPDGILHCYVPIPDVYFDTFSLYDDRIYLIDSDNESCVYEYKIIE